MHAENKSTNVRFIDGVRWVARRGPGATSRLATRVFFMPPRPRRYAWTDRSVFRGAERLPLDANELALRAWRFGRGPQVLIQHGWAGAPPR